MSRKPYKKRISYTSAPAAENIMILEEVEDTPMPVLKQSPEFKVQVDHPSLRRRRAPSINSETVGYITDKGLYNIYLVDNGWGRLEDGSWIMLQYTTRIKK